MKIFSLFVKIICTWVIVVIVLSRCGVLEGMPASPYRTYYGSQSMRGMWKWVLNYTTSTFEALGDLVSPPIDYDQTISGVFSVLDNGFIKFSIKNSSPVANIFEPSVAFGVEIPGLVLFVKPAVGFMASYGNLIAAMAAGKCDRIMSAYNWAQVSIDSSYNLTNGQSYGTAILSGVADNYSLAISSKNLSDVNNDTTWSGCSCSQGATLIPQVSSDARGVIASGAGMLNDFYNFQRAHLGFPQNSISISDLASKEFIGFHMKGSSELFLATHGVNSRILKFTFNSSGNSADGLIYSDVEADTFANGITHTISIASINNGLITGDYYYNATQKPLRGVVYSYQNRYVMALVTEHESAPGLATINLVSK